jgi:hypothetical protein
MQSPFGDGARARRPVLYRDAHGDDLVAPGDGHASWLVPVIALERVPWRESRVLHWTISARRASRYPTLFAAPGAVGGGSAPRVPGSLPMRPPPRSLLANVIFAVAFPP